MPPTPWDVTTRAAALLGGAKSLRKVPNTPMDWLYLIREGIPTVALDSLGVNVHATNDERAQMLGISVRALAWRRHKGILSPCESERLFRLAMVITRTEDVFGNLVNALAWLKDPNISLGGVIPIALLDTQIGTELVTDVLGRIEYGIVV